MRPKRHPDWPPSDWSAGAVAAGEAYGEAWLAIRARRRRLSPDAAEIIVSSEYAKRGLRLTSGEGPKIGCRVHALAVVAIASSMGGAAAGLPVCLAVVPGRGLSSRGVPLR